MKLIKYEQSGFILETDAGYKLAIDIGNKTPVEKLEKVKVDSMIISHIHGDHFSLDQIKMLAPNDLYLNEECLEALGEEALESKINKVSVWDTVNVSGIEVKYFNVDHGPNISAPLKDNFGFLIKADGKTVYFAGDMFVTSGINVSQLEVDYALLPVGTFYTFGPEEAFAFAKQFKKIGKIISMHYEKEPGAHDMFMTLASGTFDVE